MDILNNNEQGKVLGGGYWWQAPNGLWIYIERTRWRRCNSRLI